VVVLATVSGWFFLCYRFCFRGCLFGCKCVAVVWPALLSVVRACFFAPVAVFLFVGVSVGSGGRGSWVACCLGAAAVCAVLPWQQVWLPLGFWWLLWLVCCAVSTFDPTFRVFYY